MSGSWRRSWARRRVLDVPITVTAATGQVWARKSAGESRLRIAAVNRPEGRMAGISFMLCTAQSISPARIASSSARTKTPCPPISWRGTPVMSSPCVLMITVSMSIPRARSFLHHRLCLGERELAAPGPDLYRHRAYARAMVVEILVRMRCGKEVCLELGGREEDTAVQHPLPEPAKGFGVALLHLPVVLRRRSPEEVLEHRPEPDKRSCRSRPPIDSSIARVFSCEFR